MANLDLSKVSGRNPHLKEKLSKGKLQVSADAGDANKAFMLNTLMQFCGSELTLHLEYKFNATRKFRFDYYIEELNLGIEYEGIFSQKSRHTTYSGYTKDTEKYNLAALSGIKVLRYTSNTYKHLQQDLLTLLNSNNDTTNF